jgi:hypothetical protein
MSDQSEQIGELAGALAKAQGAIKTAGRAKDNPFFKSSYADLAAIREACAEALSANALAFTQIIDFDAENRWLETTLMHSSGQWIRGRYPLRPVKDDPQGLGSAVTYAKRYALAALVGVVSVDEDDDGEAASGRAQIKNGDATPAPDRKAAANKWADDALTTIQDFKTGEVLSAWHKANANAIAALRGFNEAKHGRLVAAIQKRQSDFNVLGAG